jgi:hypothetical protein
MLYQQPGTLTVRPMFFASVLSVILAKGLSAPQHSTYLVILDGDRFLSPAWSAFRAAVELEELRLPSCDSVFWNTTNRHFIPVVVTTGSPLSLAFPVAASKTSQSTTELLCKPSQTRRRTKIGQDLEHLGSTYLASFPLITSRTQKTKHYRSAHQGNYPESQERWIS